MTIMTEEDKIKYRLTLLERVLPQMNESSESYRILSQSYKDLLESSKPTQKFVIISEFTLLKAAESKKD